MEEEKKEVVATEEQKVEEQFVAAEVSISHCVLLSFFNPGALAPGYFL